MPAELAGALSMAGGRLGPFAGRVVWFDEVGSTNDLASRMADAGADEGVVVMANRQTAGRGRLGRGWESPAGAGLYLSAVLRPPPRVAPLLTIAAGVAVADGIEAATGLRAELKWPNDVHVAGRKLAGILAEGAAQHVVMGIGINVRSAALPPEVAVRAGSLEGELGRPVDRGLVLAECLAALAMRYEQLQRRENEAVLEAWRRRATWSLGREVQWESQGARWSGRAADIAEDGSLIVQADTGRVQIRAGEVRWL